MPDYLEFQMSVTSKQLWSQGSIVCVVTKPPAGVYEVQVTAGVKDFLCPETSRQAP